eukprot:11695170-Ditylum_brightwellii.AAC.1
MSQAPLVFWCYALMLVINCLNHMAKKPLSWHTLMEVLNGDMAAISAFSKGDLGDSWGLLGIQVMTLPSGYGQNQKVYGIRGKS